MLDLASLMQLLLPGVTTGCTYALVALGIVLSANVSGVINLAQGEYIAIGALVAAGLGLLHVPLALALLAVLFAGAALGALQEVVTVRPVQASASFLQITVTLGVAALMRGVAFLVSGKDPIAVPGFGGDGVFELFGAVLLTQNLWVWFGTAVMLGGVFVFLAGTSAGRAVRACAINPAAARLMGINPSRTAALVFAGSGALTAFAGALIAPLTLASWDMGLTIGLKGLLIAIFGNFRSPLLAVTGGVLLGVGEALVAGYVSSEAREVVVYSLLLLVLLAMGGVFARGRDRLHVSSSH